MAVARLAELDSSRSPAEPLLVAEREGSIEAAISLATRESIANPFRRTAELLELLRCHAGGAPAPPEVDAAPASSPSRAAALAPARGAAHEPQPTIRRELRPGDLGAIVAHHGARLPARVRRRLDLRGARGRQRRRRRQARLPAAQREGIWIVELDGRHAGSLALTDEGDGLGAVRWFVLDPTAPRARASAAG